MTTETIVASAKDIARTPNGIFLLLVVVFLSFVFYTQQQTTDSLGKIISDNSRIIESSIRTNERVLTTLDRIDQKIK